MQRLLRLAVAITCAVPVIVSAQDGQRLRDRDPDLAGAKRITAELQQANFHSGPFYLLSRVRLGDAGFQQEVYFPTGDHSGGLSLTVEAPQRLYYVPHKKTIFTAEVVPAYSFLSSAEKRGQFDYAVRADAHFLLNHLYLDVYTLRADQIRARVADVNRLTTVADKETGVAGEMKYSSRTSGLFTFRYLDTVFPADRFQPEGRPVDLLDRVERNGRVSLHHKTFPLTSLFVAAEGSSYAFRRATYKDSDRRYAGAGFIHDAGRTSLRVEAGPTSLNFDDPAQRDFSGITGEAQVTRRNGRWNYTFALDRDLGFSIFRDNNYYVAHGARLNVDYSATRKLSLRAASSYERDDYDVPVNGIDRVDDVSFSTVGFLYSFRRIRTGLDVGYYRRNSTNGGDIDSGIRYVVHLSFTP